MVSWTNRSDNGSNSCSSDKTAISTLFYHDQSARLTHVSRFLKSGFSFLRGDEQAFCRKGRCETDRTSFVQRRCPDLFLDRDWVRGALPSLIFPVGTYLISHPLHFIYINLTCSIRGWILNREMIRTD